MSSVTPPLPFVPSAPVSAPVGTQAVLMNAPPQTLQALQALQSGQSLQATLISAPGVSPIQVQTIMGLLTLQTPMNLPANAILTLVLNALNPQVGAQSATPGGTQKPGQANFQISAVNGKPVAGGQTVSSAASAAPSAPLSAGQSITVTLLRPALGFQQAGPSAQSPGTQTPGTPTGLSTGTSGASPTTPGNPHSSVQGGTTQGGAAQGGARPVDGVPTQTTTQAGLRGLQSGPDNGPGGAAQVAKTADGATSAKPAQGLAGQPTNTANAKSAPQAAGSASQTTNPTTSQATTQATTLATGTRFGATVQRIDTPSAAVTLPNSPAQAAAGKALATGQVVTGTVTGRTAGGQPIVQTPTATFALDSNSALNDGTKVTFRLETGPLTPARQSATGAAPTLNDTHSLITAKSWDDLGAALKALVDADPARLTQMATTALPQTGPKLTAQMLFFLTALKGGDISNLFGDSAQRILEKDRPNLHKRLDGDFQIMSRLTNEPQTGDWRLALIPLWTGQQLEQLRLFWRGKGSGEDGESTDEESRFVLDVDLSNLGHLQIDGLMKTKRHQLDLIIRTDQPLPTEMRADIGQLFEDTRTALGLNGQVAFQAAPGNFIAVPGLQPDTSQATHSSGLLA